MAVDAKGRLKEIVDSYLDKDGGAGVDHWHRSLTLISDENVRHPPGC
jgi:hypothetical protein